jgi:phosphatidylinositol alpha 1,6-mannosyltransferase
LKPEKPRVAYFPDNYSEIDGVAKTSRHFESYAREHSLPFLMVHVGSRRETFAEGSVTRVQLERSPMTFPLDSAHRFDLLFLRHYLEVSSLVREFAPDVVQITGPSDVGILGAVIAHRLHIPLAASWQTNLHQYARTRASAVVSGFSKSLSAKLPARVERLSFRALNRFYKIPRILFAPNQEVINLLEKTTGKPCFLMPHAVDTDIFNPAFRDQKSADTAEAPVRIGYVGRLTPEKNVRSIARLEQALLDKGHSRFQFVFVGDGADRTWLRSHMQHAEFTGILTGKDLSHAYANLDFLIFPSETDTFGLVVLEALSSGVPVICMATGGPKFSVQHGVTGMVAENFDEFVASTEALLKQRDLRISMRAAAREYALSTSWDHVFDTMYAAYERFLPAPEFPRTGVLDVATT